MPTVDNADDQRQYHAIDPASYVVTAADLNPRTLGNEICKFADDTYLIFPACSNDSRVLEIRHSIERSHEKLCLEIAEESVQSGPLHLWWK